MMGARAHSHVHTIYCTHPQPLSLSPFAHPHPGTSEPLHEPQKSSRPGTAWKRTHRVPACQSLSLSLSCICNVCMCTLAKAIISIAIYLSFVVWFVRPSICLLYVCVYVCRACCMHMHARSSRRGGDDRGEGIDLVAAAAAAFFFSSSLLLRPS